MSQVIVFSGPSISPREAQQRFPEAVCFGPAAQGDVYAICRHGPKALCLIDGYFEHQPSVMHKELLWAISRGTSVFGAASMGALRALELEAFGMIGLGAVFQAYKRGVFEDDDTVAIAHEDAASEYRAASIALVDLHATLDAAQVAGLPQPACEAMRVAARRLFYADRTFPNLLSLADTLDLPEDQVRALRSVLEQPARWVFQKRKDAEQALDHVRALFLANRLEAPAIEWSFPHTEAWWRLVRHVEESPRHRVALDARTALDDGLSCVEAERRIFEEVQLLGPEAFADVMLSATWRLLGECIALFEEPAPDTYAAPSASLWLGRPSDDLTLRLVVREVSAVLRSSGDYEAVAKRARAKCALAGVSPVATKPEVDEYFLTRLGRPVPQNLGGYALSVGLSSAEGLLRVIGREMQYLRSTAAASAT